MDIQLVVASGSKAGQVIAISGPKFIIGRADDCHLKPRSELISRYHCAVISEENYVAVRDLGSKNGVYLNGERVSMEHELKNGDKLTVGPLEFFVHLTVAAKAQKKSKVESISEAVSRTVEIQSGTAEPNEKEAEIADWLLTSGESDQDNETKTVESSADIMETIQANFPPKKETSPPPPAQNPPAQGPGTGSHGGGQTKPGDANSRDAAANLLKNFFKGGR